MRAQEWAREHALKPKRKFWPTPLERRSAMAACGCLSCKWAMAMLDRDQLSKFPLTRALLASWAT